MTPDNLSRENIARQIIWTDLENALGRPIESVNLNLKILQSESFFDCDVKIESFETGQTLGLGSYTMDLSTFDLVHKPDRWILVEKIKTFSKYEQFYKNAGLDFIESSESMTLDDLELRYLYDTLISIFKSQSRFQDAIRISFSKEALDGVKIHLERLKIEKEKYERTTSYMDKKIILLISRILSCYNGKHQVGESEVRDGYNLYLNLIKLAYFLFPEVPTSEYPSLQLDIESPSIRIFEEWDRAKNAIREGKPVSVLNIVLGTARAIYATEKVNTIIETPFTSTIQEILNFQDTFQELMLQRSRAEKVKDLSLQGKIKTMENEYAQRKHKAYHLLEVADEYEKRGEITKAVEAFNKAQEILPSLTLDGVIPPAYVKAGDGTIEDFLKAMKRGLE